MAQRRDSTSGRGNSVNPGVDRASDLKGNVRSLRTQGLRLWRWPGHIRAGTAPLPTVRQAKPLQQHRGVKATAAWGPQGSRSCAREQLPGVALRWGGQGEPGVRWPWDTNPLSCHPLPPGRSCALSLLWLSCSFALG